MASRTFRQIALLLTLALFALSFGIAAAQGGGTLRVAVNAPPGTLDPALQSDDSEIALNRAIYDYLIEVLPDSTIGPNLASEWSVSDDGLVYTFKLVEGVTFHDGSAFTAADVAWTFERLKAQSSQALNLLGDFSVTTPDDLTVQFTLTTPNADFLYGVGARQAVILQANQDTPNVIGDDGSLAEFNGTGPFKLVSYDPGSRAVLTRNETYWKEGAPLLDGLEFVYMDDQQAQVDALQSGQVDFVFRIPQTIVAGLEGNDAVTVLSQASDIHAVIRVRADAGALGEDVRVRQALKYATDRDALNDLVAQGNGLVGNNDPIAPVFGDYYDDSIATQAYDPAMACQLLEEAGKSPLEFTLYYPQDTLDFNDLAPALEQQWNSTGCITVTLQNLPAGQYYDDSYENNWLAAQVAITNWSAQPSPQSELAQAFTTEGAYNESHYSNAQVDELIAQASQTADVAARKAIYSQIAAIFAEEGPVIIPYFQPLYGATSAGVTGLTMNSFPGLTDFRSVSISS
jgi:peptide/nickel transport system substrate-binding protein